MAKTEIIQKLNEKSAPPWNFAEFMETALYDPEVGYYTKPASKLGADGDFYTSNHVNPVFAETFGRFFADVIEKENLRPEVCEWGAGDGRFAAHMLSYLKKRHPDIYANTRYKIIETSPYHRKLISEKLAEFGAAVEIFENFSDLKNKEPYFEGIIFSNELLDAFPVHVIEKGKDGWLEIKVDTDGSELSETATACTNQEVLEWISCFGPDLPEGYRSEVSPAMGEWLNDTASWLRKGMLITVDYGYTNEELKRPERKEGSIRGYKNHEMEKDPLKYPGDMDLTTHIQWDAYDQLAEKAGLEHIVHINQDRFLLKAGLFTFLESPKQVNPFTETFKKNRAIQTLVHPGGISSSFQVAVHGRNLLKTDTYKFFNEDPYQIKKP